MTFLKFKFTHNSAVNDLINVNSKKDILALEESKDEEMWKNWEELAINLMLFGAKNTALFKKILPGLAWLIIEKANRANQWLNVWGDALLKIEDLNLTEDKKKKAVLEMSYVLNMFGPPLGNNQSVGKAFSDIFYRQEISHEKRVKMINMMAGVDIKKSISCCYLPVNSVSMYGEFVLDGKASQSDLIFDIFLKFASWADINKEMERMKSGGEKIGTRVISILINRADRDNTLENDINFCLVKDNFDLLEYKYMSKMNIYDMLGFEATRKNKSWKNDVTSLFERRNEAINDLGLKCKNHNKWLVDEVIRMKKDSTFKFVKNIYVESDFKKSNIRRCKSDQINSIFDGMAKEDINVWLEDSKEKMDEEQLNAIHNYFLKRNLTLKNEKPKNSL